MKIPAFLNSMLAKLEGRPLSFLKVSSGPGPLFTLFKEVLESNNRALELITDMGEKLGGEFLFDINYIKKIYSELISQMSLSTFKFNSLTHKKYDAEGALGRVDKAIKSVLDNSSSGEFVYFYEDISWDKAGEVGGKNFNLAELKNNLRLNVPPAFALTTRAFDEFIGFNQLKEKVNSLSPEGRPEELERVRQEVLRGSFPVHLNETLRQALERLSRGKEVFLAVRSSAGEEDRDYSSFAGQFETVLNVPASPGPVKEAYKKVLASLYTPAAFAYQKRLGLDPVLMKMPVACVLMVDAASAGVMYSSNPNPLTGGGEIVISSVPGLGDLAVNGSSETDIFTVKKSTPPEVIDVRIGAKKFTSVTAGEGGIKRMEVPGALGAKPSLNSINIEELARTAQEIERYFGVPQDIEWALGKDGKIHILQSRPLKIDRTPEEKSEPGRKIGACDPIVNPGGHKILLERNGFVVQKGAVAGKAFLLKKMEELENVPRGSILVARNDSPQFVRIMPRVQAIITDIGSPVNHMAAICREFRIPSVVNTIEGTKKITHGQEITLEAREDGFAVYEGAIREIMERAKKDSVSIGELYEFRRVTYVMRHISPLNLINPLMDDFTSEKCRTMHDLLRFIHEKSVQELIDASRNYSGGRGLRKLELPVPAGIQVVDIGGGIAGSSNPGDKGHLSLKDITSLPFSALLKGMVHPDAWNSEPLSLNTGDFLSSMMRMKDITGSGLEYAGKNLAVISREYMNLSLRFGYHFNLVDSYCSERAANNHIYFRFVGGATDITKRSRRIRLIAYVLGELGFQSNSKGDLILARLSNIGREELLNILEQAGRLIAFTRQLDAVLTDDSLVERLARNFLEGKYQFR